MPEDLDRRAELFLSKFADLAKARGYEPVDGAMARPFEGGSQQFVVRVARLEQGVFMDVVVDTCVDDVARLCEELDPDHHAGDPQGRAFTLSIHEFLADPAARLRPEDPQGFPQLVSSLRPLIENQLLPMADECRTPRGLDEVMNGGRTKIWMYPLNHLIVARLCASPRQREVYERFRAGMDEDMGEWFGVTHARLRNRVADSQALVARGFGVLPDGGYRWGRVERGAGS